MMASKWDWDRVDKSGEKKGKARSKRLTALAAAEGVTTLFASPRRRSTVKSGKWEEERQPRRHPLGEDRNG